MRIEILCTGDEILTGKTINTNYSHMAQRFSEHGLTMHWGTIVGDDRASLIAAFRAAAGRADAVIVNGGLGPTVDDLSQEVAAEAAGVPLVLDEEWLGRMEGYYSRRGRTMPPNNRKQAMLPEGAEFIDNPVGTACGFAITIDGARFFFTPGVPREMRRMIDDQIIPRLLEMSGIAAVTRLKRFHSFGIGESRADQMLDGIEAMVPDGAVKLGFQAHYPQLETKLAAQGASEAALDALLAPVEAVVRERLGTFIIAEDDQRLEDVIVARLVAQGETVATAEMFTSGAIAHRFAPADGAADPFLRGMVSRNLTQMREAVGLTGPETEAGPEDGNSLSLSSAVAIADALRRQSGADHALVVMVALDEGRDRLEFGGTIYIAIASRGETVRREARLLGGREWVRLGATELALDCLRRHLQGLAVDEKIDFERR